MYIPKKLVARWAIAICSLSITASPIYAQQKTWTLRQCIDYARENNIQVQNKKISKELADVDLTQSKAQRTPSLNFNTSHSMAINNHAEGDVASYSGNYGLNSNLTIFSGWKLTNTIKQRQTQLKASEYDIAQAQFDIEVSVTQAYLQILYNIEALKIAKSTSELSKSQLERATEMQRAGSISKGDLALFQSQVATDLYSVVSAENALKTARLALKQLLELGINDNIDITTPIIGDNQVLTQIPSLNDVYKTASEELPQVKSSLLAIKASETSLEIAKGGKYPTLSANAGVSTGTYSGTGVQYLDQLNKKLNESVGLTLSVPIFNNKQARTSVNRAKLQVSSAELQNRNVMKNLLSTVESLYNDAVSSQSQYIASVERLKAAEISYEITYEKFKSGIKNPIELITEKDNYTKAQASLLQSKFNAVLALKILTIYQNKPIEL